MKNTTKAVAVRRQTKLVESARKIVPRGTKGSRRLPADLELLRQSLFEEAETLSKWHLVEDSNNTFVGSGNNVVNFRTDGGGWELLGSAWKGHIASNQLMMIAMARKFFRFNAMARAAIMGVVKYVMGKGVNITPKSKDPRIWYIWKEFWTSPRNNMKERQFEIVKRYFRDGEMYLIYFTKDNGDNNTWRTTVRFMDPIDIRYDGAEGEGSITDKTNQGIVFDENDAETPLMYYVRDRLHPEKSVPVDAKTVQRRRFPLADMDQARGESFLQQAMPYLTQFQTWLENRMILNKLRTAIVMIREIDGTASDVSRVVSNSIPASSRAASGSSQKQSIKPGTIYTANAGVKLRMDAPNINAADVKDDGRAIILQICAATGLPEYMFGDASNANYASSLVAESPTVKEIEFHQAILEGMWQEMFRRVIQAAVDAGKLEAPPEEDIFAKYGSGAQPLSEDAAPQEVVGPKDEDVDDTAADDAAPEPGSLAAEAAEQENYQETEREIFFGCDVEWPTISHRDPQLEAQAMQVWRTNGWISDKTAAEKLGLDYNEELRKQRQVEDDAKLNGNPLQGVASPDDVDDANGQQQQDEEDQTLSMFSDDEKQQILKSTDPMEIGKMLLGKIGQKKAAPGKAGKKPVVPGKPVAAAKGNNAGQK